MKKLIISIVLFLALVSVTQAQSPWKWNYLYCADYAGTDVRDTIAVNGSTDAGSGWFTGKGYDKLFLQVYNGTAWYMYQVAVPSKLFTKFKVNMEGSDTTLSVLGYAPDGQSITLPIWTTSSVMAWTLDIGVTTQYFVKFLEVLYKE